MSLVVALHLKEHIIMVADKRQIEFSEDRRQFIYHNDSRKIYLWQLGAISGCGESGLINNIAYHIIQFGIQGGTINILDIANAMRQQRLDDGIPLDAIENTSVYISYFDGKMHLLKIRFEDHWARLELSKPNEMMALMVNPSSAIMEDLKNIHTHLRECSTFTHSTDFMNYYITLLADLFFKQSCLDPTITSQFDFYLQDSRTGESLMFHCGNPKQLAYEPHHHHTPVHQRPEAEQRHLLKILLSEQYDWFKPE